MSVPIFMSIFTGALGLSLKEPLEMVKARACADEVRAQQLGSMLTRVLPSPKPCFLVGSLGCLLAGCLGFNFLGFYGPYNIGASSLTFGRASEVRPVLMAKPRKSCVDHQETNTRRLW